MSKPKQQSALAEDSKAVVMGQTQRNRNDKLLEGLINMELMILKDFYVSGMKKKKYIKYRQSMFERLIGVFVKECNNRLLLLDNTNIKDEKILFDSLLIAMHDWIVNMEKVAKKERKENARK